MSRSSGEAANLIYRKLRQSGHRVFAVNPRTAEVEGDRCYPDLASIPDGVDGVVIATPPRVTGEIVRQCSELGIPRVWMHRSFGQGSVAKEAVRLCHERGISVIDGGCPMMFCEPVDFGHRCIRWFLKVSGSLPRVAVPGPSSSGD